MKSFIAVCTLVTLAPAQWTGEWRLDESSGTRATDLSGNGNHGTLNNFTGNPWVAGKFGNALAFDGVDDFVETNGGKTVFDGRGSPFSIAYWIKAKPQADRRVYSEGNKAAAVGLGALFTLGSGKGTTADKARVWFRNDKNSVRFVLDSNTVVYDDTWHHVAFVHVAGRFTIYVDGKADRSSAYGAGDAAFGAYTTDRVGIGAVLRRTACCLFAGLLDDVRVYDFALSAADVARMVSNVPRIPCSASIGKFGVGCGVGPLDIRATGSTRIGKSMQVQLTKGPANKPALLLVGFGKLAPLDLSGAGYTGCRLYVPLASLIVTGFGVLDASGASQAPNVMVPNDAALLCALLPLQGAAFTGSTLEFSPGLVPQFGK